MSTARTSSRASGSASCLAILGLAILGIVAIGACRPKVDSPEPRFVLLLTADTLRADHLGSHGYPGDPTPHLDALAAESIRFEHAYAPTSYTLASVAGLLTGRYPEEVGILRNIHTLSDDAVSVAQILQGAGWRTGAVVSNFVLRRETGFDRGFDFYDDRMTSQESVRPTPERTARHTTDAALEMLDRMRSGDSDRLFLWVHYQDPHGPYAPPPGYRDRFLEAERRREDGGRRLDASADRHGFGAIPHYQFLPGNHDVAFYRAGYAGEIRFMDEEIGRLLTALRERGLLQASVVVFSADHGESMGERDYWFGHGEYLNDAMVHVPMLWRVNGLSPGTRSDLASLLDIVPTLCGILGLEVPAGHRGRDLLARDAATVKPHLYLSLREVSSRPRFALIEGNLKYVYSPGFNGNPPEEDLSLVGGDTRNRAVQELERARDLRQRLAEMMAGFRPIHRPKIQTLSEADRAALESLGYISE